MSSYRSSDPHLAYGDDYDYAPRAPQRWDRDTFERYRDNYRRPPAPVAPVLERERIRVDERSARRGDRDIDIDIDINEGRRGPRTRTSEVDLRFREDERLPSRRVDFYEPDPNEVAAKALQPYRRRVSIVEQDVAPRRVQRPGMLRRISSVDTFDRRPPSRYHDEYRIPAGVNVPLPIRRSARERERDVEEIKIRERDPSSGTEYSEDIHIHRRKGGRKEKKEEIVLPPPPPESSSSSSSEEEVVEEIEETKSVKSSGTKVEEEVIEEKEEVVERGRRGKTRLPKRLAHRDAIIELEYAFEEEDDFYIVRRALGKEHIDEIIELSKTYKIVEVKEKEKRIYKYEIEAERAETVREDPPKSVRAESVLEDGLPDEYIKTTTIIHERDDASTIRSPSPAPTVRTYRTTTRAPRAETIVAADVVEESAPIPNALGSLVPHNRERRSERDIRQEIDALEIERQSLRRERFDDDRRRHHSRHRRRSVDRETDYEFVEKVERHRRSRSVSSDRKVREVIRVEKDRKGRMALVRSAR